MVSEHPTANRISINAAEQDDCIESVTVFQSDSAEIKRRVKLDLKVRRRPVYPQNNPAHVFFPLQQGQNHVDVERLPSYGVPECLLTFSVGSGGIQGLIR
ncbi:hypothetical protein FS749_001259 [Ceratobasidium sp. UAMH 11750]|nr:hypothetical protein FS749_001259 [Ceratobasidium sp. UAMH 11750]